MINKVEICGVNTAKLPILTNKEKEEQIDDLVAKRQEQEAKAATYAHQRQEIASLMSSQDNAYTDQSVHIKRMSA